jgi:reductive dehalogenase
LYENKSNAAPGETEARIEFRNQNNRYPWWVKSVDTPTIEMDRGRAKRPDIRKTTALFERHMQREDFEEFIKASPDVGLKYNVGTDKMIDLWKKRWNKTKESAQDNVPGFGIRDWALFYAAYGNFMGYDFDYEEVAQKTQYVNLVERFGVTSWRGSKQEASDMVEKAAKALGVSQVGFTLVDQLILYDTIELPPEMKYVIVLLIEWPPETSRRVDTPLGRMGIRVTWFRQQNVDWGLRNFIRGLGYRVRQLPAPQPAYAVLAGLGELGRINRLVSPVYGATLNLGAFVTDMPLAIDKPINFGLQRFCMSCNKCARLCPVGALSMAKKPTWEPKGEWNTPGKKVYFEESLLCSTYCQANNSSCSICLSACPWTKQNKTVLHRLSKTVSATAPFATGFMVKMDDLFGYGPTKDPKKLEEWWDLDLPSYGIETEKPKH